MKRPYELTGAAYAVWYDVGQKLGMHPQSAVAHALCGERGKLPSNVDTLTVVRINQVAAERGMVFEMA